MKKRVMCVKYGWAIIEAGTDKEAEEIAKNLSDSAFDWSDTDDFQVVEDIDYE